MNFHLTHQLMQLGCGAMLLTASAAMALDRGGLTFDFAQASAERFSGAPQSAVNYLTNGDFQQPNNPKDILAWRMDYCHIHSAEVPGDSPLREKVRQIVKWQIKDQVGSIIKPEALLECCQNKPQIAQAVSGGFAKFVKLPHNKGGNYQLDLSYRMNHKLGNGGYVIVSYYNKPANKSLFNIMPVGQLQIFDLQDSGVNWQKFSRQLQIPADINYIDVIVRIDGIGQLDFKQVKFTEATATQAVTLKLSPHGFIDHTFAVSQNQPAIMTFIWKANQKIASAPNNLKLVLHLPSAYEFVSATNFTQKKKWLIAKQADGSSKIILPIANSSYFPRRQYNFYLRLPMMITTQSAPGMRQRATIHAELGGKIISNLEPIYLQTIPTIKTAARPQNYCNGIYTVNVHTNFYDNVGDEKFARLMQDCGVQWVVAGLPEARLNLWRACGIKHITPEMYYVGNGYTVGRPEFRGESDKFRFVGQSCNWQQVLDEAVCPHAIYSKGQYFQQEIRPLIRKTLSGCDGLWGNWEPFMFEGMGCMCDTCRANFARFAKIPLEQLKQEWPQELARGKKYYDQIVRFRSLEHAKVIKTLQETVLEATGGNRSLGFIPGVAWEQVCSSWRHRLPMKEALPHDYAGSLRWLNAWGPYPCWDTQGPYSYDKTGALTYFVAARDVRQQINRDYPVQSRPKLMAFPHGAQVSDWVTQPEFLELALDTFFFNGFEASIVYYFPRGYDNRYWAAFSRAVARAARYEKFVQQGHRVDKMVKLTPVAEYAAPSGRVTEILPQKSPISLLQHAAYRRGDKMVIACFNFWTQNEAFFAAQIAGLPPEKTYTVTCGSEQFTPNRQRYYFTGKELSSGIKLHAGLARCAVYEIAPGQKLLSGKTVLTTAQLQQLYRTVRPQLARDAAADRQFEALNNPVDQKLQDMANAGISAQAQPEKFTLIFRSGARQLELNTREMSIVNWSRNGRQVVRGTSQSGLGTVAFWHPAWQPSGNFRVKRQMAIPAGLRIQGEMRVTNFLQPELDNLKILQTIDITEHCRKAVITTEIVNLYGDEMPRQVKFGLRYHAFPVAPALPGGQAQLQGIGGKLVNYQRNFRQHLFSRGHADFDRALTELFDVKQPDCPIQSSVVHFTAPQFPTLSLKVAPESEFGGFALWDTPRQYCATFEPGFKLKTLPPKGRMVYQLTAEIQ